MIINLVVLPEIAEPVPSKGRNLRVCFGFASQPLRSSQRRTGVNVSYNVLLAIILHFGFVC